MRWIVLLHLWLSALLSVQQPSVLVRGDCGPPARTETDARDDAPQPWTGDEAELPAVCLGGEPSLKALRVPSGPPPVAWRWVELEREAEGWTPRSCDVARDHWRAAQLPPRGPLEDEPPARA